MILFLLFLVLLVLGIVYFLKSKKNNEPNDKAKKTLLASLVFFVLFAIRCVSVDAFAMLGSIVFLVGIGYFVYCNGVIDKKAFDARLEFDIKLIPYTGDDSWVEKTIHDAIDCLKSDTLPSSGPDCDFCAYRAAVRKFEG